MTKRPEEKIVRFDEDKIVVLGPSFDFWLNEEDDVYDTIYAEREASAGEHFSRGDEFSGQTKH